MSNEKLWSWLWGTVGSFLGSLWTAAGLPCLTHPIRAWLQKHHPTHFVLRWFNKAFRQERK